MIALKIGRRSKKNTEGNQSQIPCREPWRRRTHSPIIVPRPRTSAHVPPGTDFGSLRNSTLLDAGGLSNRPLGVKSEVVRAAASIIAIHIPASTGALPAIHWRWIICWTNRTAIGERGRPRKDTPRLMARCCHRGRGVILGGPRRDAPKGN